MPHTHRGERPRTRDGLHVTTRHPPESDDCGLPSGHRSSGDPRTRWSLVSIGASCRKSCAQASRLPNDVLRQKGSGDAHSYATACLPMHIPKPCREPAGADVLLTAGAGRVARH